ncbi:hypothetical protein DM02DRAFT_436308 [Periconia macrospinosa]|uniref:HRDC domain-containing protein n=1 Tax=Periconia macrospinosa TaxID=97972 RepID=A0A2V1DMV1_9PLEO|nr:hypothetical protein DM02DRAFT_436308 [Periconia macrospinosa]
MNNRGQVSGERLPGNASKATDVSDEGEINEWRLSFRITPQTAGKRWWSHNLYKDPKGNPVKVFYSRTKEQSENLAQRFLDEPVVGFDMEWPVNPKQDRLQDKIGLIQVACEDTIALFHIGVHVGSQSEQIIAPSLRKLIESPDIAKTGVNILHADFSRLKKHFGLRPQGAFELSHLHNLVTFSKKPELLRTKLVKLASQVEEHLGLPLSKGSVRTSNWSQPLNQQQIDYAAADAYAGFMLFHSMNKKRMALVPIPPLPIFAERYAPGSNTGALKGALLLHPSNEGGSVLIAKDFFEQANDDNGEKGLPAHRTPEPTQKRQKKQTTSEVEDPSTFLDMSSRQLFEQLMQRRRELAKDEGMPAYIIANNDTLEILAVRRPRKHSELLDVKGIGPVKQEKYGSDWLQVISQFVKTENRSKRKPSTHPARPAITIRSDRTPGTLSAPPPSTNRSNPTPITHSARSPVTPLPKSEWGPLDLSDLSDLSNLSDSSESSYFGSPKPRVPQMHTGLSFNFADVELDDEIPTAGPSSTPTPGPLRNCQAEFERSSSQHRAQMRQTTTPSSQVSINPPTFNSSQHRAQMRQTTAPSSQVSINPPTLNTSPASSSVYYTPSSMPPSKRPASPHDNPGPSPSGPPPSFSPANKIFWNKLQAYSRQIARKLPGHPPNAGPLASRKTLNMMVLLAPTTKEELRQIPDISEFLQACNKVGADLLEKVIKFTPAQS